MKKLSEVIDYYYKELTPALKKLEVERKRVKTLAYSISFIILIFLLLLIIPYQYKHEKNYFVVFFMLLFVMPLIHINVQSAVSKKYRKNFKDKIIKKLIHFIDPQLRYSPERYVSKDLFLKSKIVPNMIDRYSGNDYISGVIDGVKLEFSDVKAEKTGSESKDHLTLFEGVFMRASFPKAFKGRTLVLPDDSEKIFGSYLAKKLQAVSLGRGELIKLDHPEFEKYFVVYGSDQIESRYILSHSLMERIVEFRKRTNEDITLSFIDNEMFLAIHYDKDTLEPSISDSLFDYKVAKQYADRLLFCIGIVEFLNLKQKVWSK